MQIGSGRSVPPVMLAAIATAGSAATATVSSGDNQKATVNALLRKPVTLHVADKLGNPVPGVRVAFWLSPLETVAVAAEPAVAIAASITGGTLRPLPICTRMRCLPAVVPSVQRARASPRLSVRDAAPLTLPPSSATQASGMSESARPVLSVSRTPIWSERIAPTLAEGGSPICAARVLAATGSASATTTSALST